MNIGILTSREPTLNWGDGGMARLLEATMELGHTATPLYEPLLSFFDGTVFYENAPLKGIDIVLARPTFVEEPSLHRYVIHLLKQSGLKVINGGAGYTLSKNKLDQHALMAQHNLPCPRWGIARKPDMAKVVAQKLGFPLIIKMAFGTHGKGVFYADSPETLSPITSYLSVRDGNPLILEQYIAEAQRKDLRVFLIDGEIIAAMERTAPEGDVRANTSAGGTGSPVQLTDEEVSLAKRAAMVFDLEIAGVDIIRSNRGPLLLEVNANPGFKELERVSNVDVGEAIIKYVCTK